MQKILIIEDEQDLADLIGVILERAEFSVIKAHDGIAGTELALLHQPDLIILDLMLPGRDGFSVYRELRRDPRTLSIPVIMLSARSQTEDKIAGLELGADDYLTKPFSTKELTLRVRSILKRSAPSSPTTSPDRFVLGDFAFDKKHFQFYLKSEKISLTSTEFKLLLFLCEHADQPQDRYDILRSIFHYSDAVNSRTLDTHIKRIRQKLGSAGDCLKTIRGLGYSFSLLPS